MPGHLVVSDQLLSQGGGCIAVADVPLTALHDPERRPRPSRRTSPGARSPSARPAARQRLPTARPCCAGRPSPRDRPGPRRCSVRCRTRSMPGCRRQRPSRIDDRPRRQVQLALELRITSVRSPNVQIMAAPVPLSGSARRWATTGTSTPNSGLVTVEPNSGLYRSSSGWAVTRATQLTTSSGRRADHQIALPVRAVKGQIVVGAGAGAILQLGL